MLYWNSVATSTKQNFFGFPALVLHRRSSSIKLWVNSIIKFFILLVQISHRQSTNIVERGLNQNIKLISPKTFSINFEADLDVLAGNRCWFEKQRNKFECKVQERAQSTRRLMSGALLLLLLRMGFVSLNFYLSFHFHHSKTSRTDATRNLECLELISFHSSAFCHSHRKALA